jgi:hypothetical protein
MIGHHIRLACALSALILLTACNLPGGPPAAEGTLAIAEPADGAHYRAGEWVTIRSNVAVAEGAVQVALLVDGQPVRSDALTVALQNGTMTQLWQPGAPGRYALQTRLTTASGASLDSAPVTIEVAAPAADSVTPEPTVETAAPTPTETPTPGPPMVTADQNAFCRMGPSQAYATTGELLAGASSPISGRNTDSSWWVIPAAYNDGGACWISEAVVTTSGDLSGVPVIIPPSLPEAPILLTPSGVQYCTSQITLSWYPVVFENGIARYEWEVLSATSTDTGISTDTSANYVVSCGGATYRWRVRDLGVDGTVGPYSEYLEFTVQ